MTKLALIDLDGVVIDATARFRRSEQAKEDFLNNRSYDDRINALFSGADPEKQAVEVYWRVALDPAACTLDTLVPGAQEAIVNLRREGFRIVYLTSRPTAMEDATLLQLLNAGLHDDQTLLVMKSSAFQYVKTIVWKAGMADTLVRTLNAEVLLVVDDEQPHLDHIRRVVEKRCPVRLYKSLAAVVDPAEGAAGQGDPFLPDFPEEEAE